MSITLNGLITDEKLLLIFKKIESDVLDTFTTKDYLLVNSLYHTQKFGAYLRPHAKNVFIIYGDNTPKENDRIREQLLMCSII